MVMSKAQIITQDDVSHVAKLANLKLSPQQLQKFHPQLESILEYVKLVQAAPTQQVEETSQTTGLTNVWREDIVDSTRTFTQDQALSNAHAQHNGYFVVPAIFEEQDA